jgi:hypothetical protein
MIVSIQNWKTLCVGNLLPQTSGNVMYTNIILSSYCKWGFCDFLCTVCVISVYVAISWTHATCIRFIEWDMKFSFRPTQMHPMLCGCKSLNRLKFLQLCGLKPWLSCSGICNQNVFLIVICDVLIYITIKKSLIIH